MKVASKDIPKETRLTKKKKKNTRPIRIGVNIVCVQPTLDGITTHTTLVVRLTTYSKIKLMHV